MVTNIGYKNTDIGVIPKDWDCIHLCTLGKLLSGLTYTPEDVKNYGLLVLRSSNIQEGRLCFKDNVYVNCKIEADKYVKQSQILNKAKKATTGFPLGSQSWCLFTG